MQSNDNHQPRRRIVLRSGAAVLAGLAAATAGRDAAAADKLTKAAVQYVDKATSPGKDCDDCMQWIAGAVPGGAGACRVVEGAISPHGHCIAFTPRRRE